MRRDEFFWNTGEYSWPFSDGRISNPGQMVVALAMGADAHHDGSCSRSSQSQPEGSVCIRSMSQGILDGSVCQSEKLRDERDDIGPVLRRRSRRVCASHLGSLYAKPESHAAEELCASKRLAARISRSCTARRCSSGSLSLRLACCCARHHLEVDQTFFSGFSLPSHVSQRHSEDSEREILRETARLRSEPSTHGSSKPKVATGSRRTNALSRGKSS